MWLVRVISLCRDWVGSLERRAVVPSWAEHAGGLFDVGLVVAGAFVAAGSDRVRIRWAVGSYQAVFWIFIGWVAVIAGGASSCSQVL